MISAFEHIQADNFDETEHLDKAAALKKRAERLAQLSFAVNLVGMASQMSLCVRNHEFGFRPGWAQTGLYNHRRWLEAGKVTIFKHQENMSV